MNMDHTATFGRLALVAACLIGVEVLPGCAPITTVDLRSRDGAAAAQNIENLNQEIRNQAVTVWLTNGQGLAAVNTRVQADSTRFELTIEGREMVVPTDSISEIFDNSFKFDALPKPILIGGLWAAVYTGLFRPTYHDESGAERRVSLPQGFLYGGFLGFVYGFAGCGGTAYKLLNDPAPDSVDVSLFSTPGTAPTAGDEQR